MLIWVSTYQVRFAGGEPLGSVVVRLGLVCRGCLRLAARPHRWANDLRLDDDQWHAPHLPGIAQGDGPWSAWMGRGVRAVLEARWSYRCTRCAGLPVMYDSDLPAGMCAPEESRLDNVVAETQALAVQTVPGRDIGRLIVRETCFGRTQRRCRPVLRWDSLTASFVTRWAFLVAVDRSRRGARARRGDGGPRGRGRRRRQPGRLTFIRGTPRGGLVWRLRYPVPVSNQNDRVGHCTSTSPWLLIQPGN